MWCDDLTLLSIYYEMICSIRLVSTFSSWHDHCPAVVLARTLKVCSHSSFGACNTVSLTLVTMMCLKPLELEEFKTILQLKRLILDFIKKSKSPQIAKGILRTKGKEGLALSDTNPDYKAWIQGRQQKQKVLKWNNVYPRNWYMMELPV